MTEYRYAGRLLLSADEYTEFSEWLRDCCGYDLETMVENEQFSRIADAFDQWQNEKGWN